jgi:hypothetical protein
MTAARISYIGTSPTKYSLESIQLLTAVGSKGSLVSASHTPYSQYSQYTVTEVQITLRTGEYSTQEVTLESGEKVLYTALYWIDTRDKETTTYPMNGLLKPRRLQSDNAISEIDGVEIDRRMAQRKRK